LIEKEIVTPETYPLSLNGLIGGCNQKSSRDPVMELNEEQVRRALHALEEQELIAVVRDSRVPKFEHRARTVFQLRRDETAVLCLLLLRGPQTPGELRARSERLYAFDGIDAVESTLSRLASPPENDEATGNQSRPMRPLVTLLPRQPGSREARYAHLLSGEVAANVASTLMPRTATSDAPAIKGLTERVRELEAEVEALREAVRRIESKLGNGIADSETASGVANAPTI
jgi:uncharacterized protein YceH (UPF0502 family)